jgi:hypothetical protein
MRAKTVYENINFERGKDPKSVIGIGMESQIKEWFKASYPKEVYTLDNALIYSSKDGKIDYVKYLLAAGAADIHAEDDRALQLASDNGHTEAVKMLLDAGANVHGGSDDNALRWASINGHAEVVKLLLDAGADVHGGMDYSLIWASKNGHTEVVKLLLDAGADVHTRDDLVLQRTESTEVLKLLKDHVKKTDKLVNESINFERGQDPKDALNIGNPQLRADNKIKNFIREEMGKIVKKNGGSYKIRKTSDPWSGSYISMYGAYYTPNSWNSYLIKAFIQESGIEWEILKKNGSEYDRAYPGAQWFRIRSDFSRGDTNKNQYPSEYFNRT